MLSRPICLAGLVIAIGVGATAGASAQGSPGNAAAAEALFQEGRTLLMAGKVDEACPKLEESLRLESATGTLMAVALCHEQQGKLASAWAAFADVEARSRLDGRGDRERTAREHGAALRPRLSTLTLELQKESDEISRVALSIDGVAIGPGAWNVAIPIDGGDHVVGATAAGKKPWNASISIGREHDHKRIVVPLPLAPIDLTIGRAGPSAPTNQGVVAGAPPTGGGWQRIVGLALLGAGGLGLGAAAVLALDANGDYDAAVAECTNGQCPPVALGRAQDARDQGDLATVVAITSGVIAIGGAALWWWDSRRTGRSASTGTGAQLAPGVRGFALTGRF